MRYVLYKAHQWDGEWKYKIGKLSPLVEFANLNKRLKIKPGKFILVENGLTNPKLRILTNNVIGYSHTREGIRKKYPEKFI